MNLDVRNITGTIASLTWVTVRSFVVTMLAFALLGVVLAVGSYYLLRESHWGYRLLAVSLAIIECVGCGFFLGTKRASASAISHGLSKARIGQFFVRQLFERMPGLNDGHLATQLERLPLAQAEEMLGGASRKVAGEAAPGSWLRRKIQGILLSSVEKYTLARFREEGKSSGIHLTKVQAELEHTLDEALLGKVRRGINFWTAIVLGGLLLVVAVQAGLLYWLAR